MLWMTLFQYSLMTVIQEICAHIGLVTGSSLRGVLKRKFSKKVIFPIAGLLLLIVKTINIGADIWCNGRIS
jgi:Mn2+/Fe2+ NRAMP family transporter